MLLVCKVTYLEVKSSGVLGLPPDDDRDPSDEQQQQHSHCCELGVSREHLAGPLGHDQAQDGQQENCKGHGGGEQAGLQKTKMSGPRVTPLPRLPTAGRAMISPSVLINEKDTFPPYPANLRILSKRNPTAHQAGRHIHRQSAQISGSGWCWEGTTDSLECLRFLLQVQSPKDFLQLQTSSQFCLLFSPSCLRSDLAGI